VIIAAMSSDFSFNMSSYCSYQGYRLYPYHWALRHTIIRIIQTKSYQRRTETVRDQFDDLLAISVKNFTNGVDPCPIANFDSNILRSLVAHCERVENMSTRKKMDTHLAAFGLAVQYDVVFEMMWAAYLASLDGEKKPVHIGGSAGYPSECEMTFFAAAICRHFFHSEKLAGVVLETYRTLPLRDFVWTGAPDITWSQQEGHMQNGVERAMKMVVHESTEMDEDVDGVADDFLDGDGYGLAEDDDLSRESDDTSDLEEELTSDEETLGYPSDDEQSDDATMVANNS
jgi:hypothetical protein